MVANVGVVLSVGVSNKEFEKKFNKLKGLLRVPVDSTKLNTYEDYLAIARVGLWDAYCSFQEGRGAKFDTYAAQCMRNAVYTERRKGLAHRAEIARITYTVGVGSEACEAFQQRRAAWTTRYLEGTTEPEIYYTRILMLARFTHTIFMPDYLRVFDYYWTSEMEPGQVSRELGVPYKYVVKVITQTLSSMRLLYGLLRVYPFATLLAYIDSVGVTLPKLPKEFHKHLIGGLSVMAVTAAKLTSAQFKECFSGHTANDLIEEKWPLEFGVELAPKAKADKATLLTAMYENYSKRYEEGVDLMEKEAGLDPGVSTKLDEGIVGQQVTCPEDGDDVVYTVTSQEGEALVIQAVGDEDQTFDVTLDAVKVIKAELAEGIQVWCDEDGEGTVYSYAGMAEDGQALLSDGDNEYPVDYDTVHAVEAGAEEEAEEEEAEEAVEEAAEEAEEAEAGEAEEGFVEGVGVWCDEDGETEHYTFVSADGDTATIAGEDGTEYPVPLDSVHAVETEEEVEEEEVEEEVEEEEVEEEEVEEGVVVGSSVTVPADGDDVAYEVKEVDEGNADGALLIENADGDQYRVGPDDVTLVE